jgi:hypothetical protein
VIPRHTVDVRRVVPADWPYWTPKPSDLSEEGFGFFRDTWLIRGVTVAEARETLAYEESALAAVAQVARDEEEFDLLCRAVETGDLDEVPHALTGERRKAIETFAGDDASPLDGLELGVAGLVACLANVGCWPAASCRGHPGPQAWAPHPVVYLAADRHRVTTLLPLLDEADCGIAVDDSRGNLLVVIGDSVSRTAALARLVFDTRAAFRPPPRGTRRRSRSDGQQTFDYR